jgi:hypothetical protein
MSPENGNKAKLNPQITDTEIGVRELRKITIYPLSMADQLKMTDLITEALQKFFESSSSFEETETDIEFVNFIVGLIRENLGEILGLATDEVGADLLKDLTNVQASEIAEIIFTVNYETVIKNCQSLIGKVKELFPSMRQSVQSVSDTDIGLEIFTENPSEKEESQ